MRAELNKETIPYSLVVNNQELQMIMNEFPIV